MNRPGKRTRRKVAQIRQEWKDPVCRPSHRDPERAQTPVPLQAGQPLKFTVLETLDRNKEEFEVLQAQYHR
ncbi:hypothetical protein JZ751_028768 [Albula glossodonta]|uniref:Uncharacterized protein n=1 Tax=Albula glossodonta TaxID=121402 RepID=A0A8T2MP97_9TELE|nr:hypothetical protein JZ751_028768 [Albula glossodonta]